MMLAHLCEWIYIYIYKFNSATNNNKSFFVLLHFEAVAAKKAKGQKRFQIKVMKEISAVNTRCLLSDRSLNPFLKKKKN